MKFTAEVVEVKSKKAASLDIVYTIKLVTDDPSVLALGVLPADTMIDVDMEARE